MNFSVYPKVNPRKLGDGSIDKLSNWFWGIGVKLNLDAAYRYFEKRELQEKMDSLEDDRRKVIGRAHRREITIKEALAEIHSINNDYDRIREDYIKKGFN